MPYKLIRIDPINPTFELKFVDDENKVNVDGAIDTNKKTYCQDIIHSKFDFKMKCVVLIDDRNWVPGEKKTVVTCQEESSKFKEKIFIKHRIFSGSYKPFWVEYVEEGRYTVETNIIPDTKSFFQLKKKYNEYLFDYNDSENIRMLIKRTLWFGQFGKFYVKNGLVYNCDDKLIYEI